LDEEANIGFDEVDVFDVEELIVLEIESNGKDEDIMKELRGLCVADNSKKILSCCNSSYFFIVTSLTKTGCTSHRFKR